jgi:hypothetical protein
VIRADSPALRFGGFASAQQSLTLEGSGSKRSQRTIERDIEHELTRVMQQGVALAKKLYLNQSTQNSHGVSVGGGGRDIVYNTAANAVRGSVSGGAVSVWCEAPLARMIEYGTRGFDPTSFVAHARKRRLGKTQLQEKRTNKKGETRIYIRKIPDGGKPYLIVPITIGLSPFLTGKHADVADFLPIRQYEGDEVDTSVGRYRMGFDDISNPDGIPWGSNADKGEINQRKLYWQPPVSPDAKDPQKAGTQRYRRAYDKAALNDSGAVRLPNAPPGSEYIREKYRNTAGLPMPRKPTKGVVTPKQYEALQGFANSGAYLSRGKDGNVTAVRFLTYSLRPRKKNGMTLPPHLPTPYATAARPVMTTVQQWLNTAIQAAKERLRKRGVVVL